MKAFALIMVLAIAGTVSAQVPGQSNPADIESLSKRIERIEARLERIRDLRSEENLPPRVTTNEADILQIKRGMEAQLELLNRTTGNLEKSFAEL